MCIGNTESDGDNLDINSVYPYVYREHQNIYVAVTN